LFWAPLIAPMFVFQTFIYEHIGRNFYLQNMLFNLQETNYILFLRHCYVITKITYSHVKLKFYETKFSKYFTKKIREYILKDIV